MTLIVLVIVLVVICIVCMANGNAKIGRVSVSPYSLPKPRKEERILFIDTETTGLPKNRIASFTDTSNWPRLVQISWILTDSDGTILHTTDYIIRPEHFTIPSEASAIHGITNKIAKNEGYKLNKVLKVFVEIADQADTIVGHNIDFDINVIAAELYRKGFTTEFTQKQRVCTMKAGIDFCKIPQGNGYKYPTLSELYHHVFSENFEGSHNAQSDVYATMQCYFALLELQDKSLRPFRVNIVTDRMESVSVDIEAYDFTEAKDRAIEMLERGELECVGQICASSEVTQL